MATHYKLQSQNPIQAKHSSEALWFMLAKIALIVIYANGIITNYILTSYINGYL